MNAAFSNDNNSNDNNSSSSVYRALRERLATLDFKSFQTLVFLWLGAKGYRHMRSLGRRSARGRRRIGGADFIASLPSSDDVRIAIQIRHWRTPIQRRAVDELWGFMLRSGTPLGLIVTNNSIYPRASLAATEYPGRPIRLVSAAALAGSMVGLGLGVRTDGGGYVVDSAFFRSLDSLRFGTRQTDTVTWASHIGRREHTQVAVRPVRRWHWPTLVVLVLIIITGLAWHVLARSGR